MSNNSTTVVGSSIAALATAERLADAGCPVELLCTGTPGAAFAGISINGRQVGAGIRLIEREYVAGENDQTPPPLHEHIPGHGGHRPWMKMINEYLSDLVPDLRPAPAPRLLVQDRWVEDFTLTGRVAAISDLFTPTELALIGAETAVARTHYGRDEGILAFPDQLAASTLETASLSNHGESFHRRIVEPLAETLIPNGVSIVAANQRHKVWAPLYWISTLNEAASGKSVQFNPDRCFWTDQFGGMTEIVASLVSRLTDSTRVQISYPGKLTRLSANGHTVSMGFDSGETHTAVDPVMGVPPGELFAATDVHYKPTRVQMTLAWAEVPEELVVDASPATMLKTGQDAFRVTAIAPQINADGNQRRMFCIEFRHDAPAITEELVASALVDATSINSPNEMTYLGSRRFDAFVVPSHESRADFEQAHSQMRANLPELKLVGGAAGYAADPLNEQLFSGIRTALELRDAHAY